jgi:hypothetical protein
MPCISGLLQVDYNRLTTPEGKPEKRVGIFGVLSS